MFAFVVAALAGCGRPPHPVESGAECLANLNARGVAYREVDMGEPKDSRCMVPTPVRVTAVAVRLSRPAAMSCFLAEKLDAFERGALQKLARDDLGASVVRIDHFGSLFVPPQHQPA